MRFLLLLLLTFPFLTQAQSVSEESFYNDTKIKTCYRWMGRWEAKKWMRGKIDFGYIPFNDMLGRAGRRGRGVFCWINPVSAVAGGDILSTLPEVYGSYLVKIELDTSKIFFNRNDDAYYRDGIQIMSPTRFEALGVDSPIMYANYDMNGYLWFQEILIKDASAIKSWTLNSPELKEELNRAYDQFVKKETPFYELHFFYTICASNEISVERKLSCEKYLSVLNSSKDFMTKAWENNFIPEKTFYNIYR
ncbi:MAG: hypothetical protein AB7I27_14550 [Bacteriovoracaceae bacterium]